VPGVKLRCDGESQGQISEEILSDWTTYELDDSIYAPAGSVKSLDLQVSVLPFDPLRTRAFDGQEYWLGIEQVRDVIEGLQDQLARRATPEERLKAVAHYAKFDALRPLQSVVIPSTGPSFP
jgi:prophage tail gpP-like protein